MYNPIQEILNNIKSNIPHFKNPEQLLKWMDVIKYGWMDKNFNKYYSFDNWWELYSFALPEQTAKYKIGTCYEQAFLEADVFKKQFSYEYKIVYIQQYNVSNHTALVYKKDDKWYWFEHSFFKYKGIHGPFSSIKSAAEQIAKSMIEYEPGDKDGWEWKILDENKFNRNLTGPEFYKYTKFNWKKDKAHISKELN